VVDIRPANQRERDGALPDAVVVDRNVLEWRTVWDSPHRLAAVTSPDLRIVLVCNQGYASTVAAATLRRLGMTRATDLAGGFQSWLRHRADPAADQ
jgi:rhodanese-related sulfurtransferase